MSPSSQALERKQGKYPDDESDQVCDQSKPEKEKNSVEDCSPTGMMEAKFAQA